MFEADWSKLNAVTLWRDWMVKSEQQWSEAVATLMKDERAGGLLARQVDEARMLHRQFAELAQLSLAAANLPSRTDLEAIDERMGRLEDGLATLAAEVARLREALAASGVVPVTRPSRARKPPARGAAKA